MTTLIYLFSLLLLLLTFYSLKQHRHTVLANSFHSDKEDENDYKAIRIYEGAAPGTKATLNEAFDRVLRQQKNCFAQLESTDPSLDWLEFDSALLMFMTTSEVPFSSNQPHQAILHLMCSSNKMRSIHFSIQITKRNRHPPKFLSEAYHFYAPASLKVGSEVGQVQVVDHDPIIYNSRIHITVVKHPAASASALARGRTGQSSEEIDAHWMVFNNGSINVAHLMTDLQLYRPYTLQLLAVDFGSPQLFSTANVTIVPVSVSQPHNLRVNVANTEYQIFEWDSPSFGIPEKYRLSISKAGKVLYTQDVEVGDNIVMSRVHFPAGPEYSAAIIAVDVEGEAPSEPHVFMLINTELNCQGECSPRGGIPMCYYGKFHKIEQYRDTRGLHCLCYDGYSSAQCDTMETCPTEKAIESYGGVAWPQTPVNQSSAILCPYNSNGEVIRRRCVWDGRLDVVRWENVSNNELCKKQSSILVHLGVLANFAQRNEQTVSGFRAVQRFLDTVLQFPSFNPNVSTAHFDSKIAEHVAQVIDGMASRNLSLVAGNTTEIRDTLSEYIRHFMARLPVPFDLRSLGEGFQLKTWHWTGPEEQQQTDKIGGGVEEVDDGSHPVQLGRRCYVHLPAKPSLDHSSAIQMDSEVVRVGCLKTSSLYPHLDGKSPVLFIEIDEEENREEDDRFPPATSVGSSHSRTRKLPLGTKALIGLRPELSTAMTGPNAPAINYTCAYYDENEHTWSITGITVLSRNFESGFVLCETTHLSVFSLLPESLFTSKRMTSLESIAFILPIATAFVAIVCTIFLLLIALFQRAKYTDPALITFLLTILLVHLVHLLVLITPHFSASLLQPWDNSIYLLLQYALISVGAIVALLNSAIHSRIAAIELDCLKGISRWSRHLQVFCLAVAVPICLCLATWMLDGYVFYGVTSRNPTLKSFNWTFISTCLIPLVLLVGSAIGYGFYSLYYGNSLAKQQGQTSVILMTNCDANKRIVLLRDLANAAGLSLLLLLLFYSEALVFYQRSNVTKSLILAHLHLGLSLAVLLFAGCLYRIELKFPRFSHHLHTVNSHRNGQHAFTAVNTTGEIYEEPKQQFKANGSKPTTNGYHNPHSPDQVDKHPNSSLDRQILLDHCHPPSSLAVLPGSTLNTTLQFRANNNSMMGDHILSRHSFLAYKEKGLENSLRRCSQPVAVLPSTNPDYYGILSARQMYTPLVKGNLGFKTSAVQRQESLAKLKYSQGTLPISDRSLQTQDILSPTSNKFSPLSTSLIQNFLSGETAEDLKRNQKTEPPPPSPLSNRQAAGAMKMVKAKFADEEDEGEIIREAEEKLIQTRIFARDKRGSLASASSSSELSHPLVSVV